MAGREPFGNIRRQRSGRYQVRYVADGIQHTAGATFATKSAARAWLAQRHAEIARGEWKPPGSTPRMLTFWEYALRWLSERSLKPRTKDLYARLFAQRTLPAFGATPLMAITAPRVREWHARRPGEGHPTATAHSYALLQPDVRSGTLERASPTAASHVSDEGSGRGAANTRTSLTVQHA